MCMYVYIYMCVCLFFSEALEERVLGDSFEGVLDGCIDDWQLG